MQRELTEKCEVARFATGSRTNSSMRRTATARVAARRPARRSNHPPGSSGRSSRPSKEPMRPTKHIFVGSKAPWFEITDDLPQFEEHAS